MTDKQASPERRDPAEQIAEVTDLVREVLGDDAIGAYLHGSTATGKLQPHSDIDVLVVARRPTTLDEKRTLIDRLLPISGSAEPSGRSRSIELTIVVQADLRPWRYPPRFDFLYGDWLRADFRAGKVTPWESPNPDVATLLTMALAAGRTVFGPPLAEILDPVPAADNDRAIVEGIPGLHADLDSDTANVLLTFARIWVTLATSTIRSKDEAADWVLPRLPERHRAVLVRARGVYLGTAEDRWDDVRDDVRVHAEYVIAEIERLSRSPARREPGAGS